MVDTLSTEPEDSVSQDHLAIEMTGLPRSSDESQARSAVERLSGSVDEKVEFRSSSPRFYRPSTDSLEEEPKAASLRSSHKEAATSKPVSSLPSSNMALTQLVAKWAPEPESVKKGEGYHMVLCTDAMQLVAIPPSKVFAATSLRVASRQRFETTLTQDMDVRPL